jgi:hypothetical protein
MTRDPWDETWRRLREWTNGQAPSERLAAQLLLFDGYEGVDPSHPLGGPDGGKDILCTKDGLRCLAAVYFPREQQKLREIKSKFRGDFRKAKSQQPPIDRFLFVTNQELRLADREELRQAATEVARDIEVELYHLERITALLDSPGMQAVRSQFLGIGGVPSDGPGGRGGNAYAIGARSTAIGGKAGRGGLGPGGDAGHGVAAGDRSVSIAGNGGDAAQPGGVGGRGARGPTERFGFPSYMWGPGRGGRGPCTPEFIRLSEVLSGICREYLERFPQDAPFINAGLEQVPTDWLNQRLVELGEMCQVDGDDTFRTLRSVDHLPQAQDIRGMILLGEPSPTADGAGSGGGES